MISTVYSATERVSKKSYVGVTSQTVDARWRQHVTSAARTPSGRLQRAIRKQGADAFDVEVRAQLPTFEEAQIAERILIALEEPALNATLGGEGRLGISGPRHTEASRARISAAHKGKTVSAETRAKLSKAMTGKPGHSPSVETRAKIGAAHKGNTHCLGRKHSPETRARMSALAKGKTSAERKKVTP